MSITPPLGTLTPSPANETALTSSQVGIRQLSLLDFTQVKLFCLTKHRRPVISIDLVDKLIGEHSRRGHRFCDLLFLQQKVPEIFPVFLNEKSVLAIGRRIRPTGHPKLTDLQPLRESFFRMS